MDRAMVDAVTRVLTGMARMLANPPSVDADLVRQWVVVMTEAGLTPAEVRQAATRVLLTERFFPAPTVLIQAARPREDEELAAERTWQWVRDCIHRHGINASLAAADFGGDGAALWAVSRMGWERLCEHFSDDKLAIWRAEFVRVYRLARSQGESLAYLPGRFERENGARGFALSPALVGRPNWARLPELAAPGEERLAELTASVGKALP